MTDERARPFQGCQDNNSFDDRLTQAAAEKGQNTMTSDGRPQHIDNTFTQAPLRDATFHSRPVIPMHNHHQPEPFSEQNMSVFAGLSGTRRSMNCTCTANGSNRHRESLMMGRGPTYEVRFAFRLCQWTTTFRTSTVRSSVFESSFLNQLPYP